MATSADAFLADLEDLEDDFVFSSGLQSGHMQDQNAAAYQEQQDDEDDDGMGAVEDTVGISKMLKSAEFLKTMEDIRVKKDQASDIVLTGMESDLPLAEDSFVELGPIPGSLVDGDDHDAAMLDAAKDAGGTTGTVSSTFTEDDPEYKLVSKCNDLVKEIEEEMYNLYAEVKNIYQQKFPQLGNILANPFDYLLVVQRIGGEDDLSKIDFSDILPNQLIMTLTITATHSKSAPIEQGAMDRVGGVLQGVLQRRFVFRARRR